MSLAESDQLCLAFIGGTGPEGRGLAVRLAMAGHTVVLGSRRAERASEVALQLREITGLTTISGMDNAGAAESAEIVILTIPYAGLADTIPPLRSHVDGKIVVSAIAPVEFREGRPYALRVDAGSAAEEVQSIVPGARVVSAFQTVDSHQLLELSSTPDTDVIVCSDDADARRAVVHLATQLPGVRGLSGGRLRGSRYVEECTALLITLNRIYKAHSGIRITGVDR